MKFQKDDVWQKNQLELSSKDERPTGGNVVPASYKSFGISKKNKDFVAEFGDQQVHSFICKLLKWMCCICMETWKC